MMFKMQVPRPGPQGTGCDSQDVLDFAALTPASLEAFHLHAGFPEIAAYMLDETLADIGFFSEASTSSCSGYESSGHRR